MPSAARPSSSPVCFLFGENDFGVKQRARQLFEEWVASSPGSDQEILDGAVSNSGEALKALGRLREALQTLPFFGTGKIIWLRNCNFLGDDRTASSQAVTATLAEIAQELKEFDWQNIRLLISAGKADKRKVFYKAIEKLGDVENFEAWSVDDRDWAAEAEAWARKGIRSRQKDISEEALAELIGRIGPNPRQLESEIEKLSLYVGDRPGIGMDDVLAVCARNKAARAFALGDALGDRDVPRLLSRLDEELWGVKFDSQKSEIGLLYGLIGKVRAMLLLKEMLREGWVKPERDYQRFKKQLESVPAEGLPADRRFNPLALNPYVLYKALSQVKQYSSAELVRAMDLLLQCNRRLVSSGVEASLALQQALVQIASRPEAEPHAAAR